MKSVLKFLSLTGGDGGFLEFEEIADAGLSVVHHFEELGAGEIVLTSMDADGTKAGYDLEMTQAVADAVTIPVVASGGAGSPEHLFDALTRGKADAALAASIFHYNEFGIRATKEYLWQRGVPVRLT